MKGRGGVIGNRELQTPTAFSSTYSVLFLLTNITLCLEFLSYFPRLPPPREFRVSVLGFLVSFKFLALLTFLPGSRMKWLTFIELIIAGSVSFEFRQAIMCSSSVVPISISRRRFCFVCISITWNFVCTTRQRLDKIQEKMVYIETNHARHVELAV